MWTPRRIFFGLLGLLVVAAGYFGYSRVLGRYDGLPPLPEQFLHSAVGTGAPVPLPPGTSMTRRFEQAFGRNCNELNYPIKTESNEKGILFAAHKFEIIPTGEQRAGWVKLYPLSLAVIGKKLGADGTPEVNTLYADMAYLRFDKPVKALSDLNGRKIMAAELHANPEAVLGDHRKGRVRVQNNRRTPDVNDDVELVTPGPVYYDEQPRPGRPHIYTFTAVQMWDHLNTGLVVPNRSEPREPTVTGIGMRVYLSPDAKNSKKPVAKSNQPRLPIPRKEPKPGVSGVDLIELDHSVEMNIWTDANASFVAPGEEKGKSEDRPPTTVARVEPKKKPAPVEKRLLQIRTNGPFRYDMIRELAHFERPANPKPGLIEYVTVSRPGRTTGQDTLVCEFMDVQFQRKKLPPTAKVAPPPPVPENKKDTGGPGDADLEIKSIRAWGESVVVTSDSENLHATGAELNHDAEARMTVLKGNSQQQIQAVKDGNLIRGSELHLFGDGKEISQAHVLGAGSIGIGDLDPKTGEYQKQAYWTDRFVFTRQRAENGKPAEDILTFLGKDGGKATFKDTSDGTLRQIDAHQLKVYLEPTEKDKDGKRHVARRPSSNGSESKDDVTRSARPTRMEAIGEVKSTAPDVVIKHTEYLDVVFQDVNQLVRPPEPKELARADAKKDDPKNPSAAIPDPKTKAGPKKEPVKEQKPLVVVARTIKTWVNRDPNGKTEIDRVEAKGEVEAHQDPATKDEQGTDIAGETVEMQAFAEGNRLVVIGDPSDRKNQKWGVVRFDQLTVFGFNIVIDQRTNTSAVRGEGSMEILSATDMEGKKLEKPTKMSIYWKHKMDFLGADKLIYYHGGVQAYQESSRLKCEWMQVVLDRPVFLNQERRPRAAPPKVGPDGKKENNNPKIDTVMCFHAPRDEDVPKPKSVQPVTVVEQVEENGKIVRFQSIQAPEVVTVSTPLENGKSRNDLNATSSDIMPGTVRLWQPGKKDGESPPDAKGAPRPKSPPRKKGELAADEEMKLTVVQFGGKMIANDLRKRAKFFTNVRVVHLAADSPTVPVDLREGDIPKGAVYLEARDSLDVFSTAQKERDPATGKEIEVSYQEMIATGAVRVRKQGEFFGDADRVTYSELKQTLTLHGSDRNPATIYQQRGTGVAVKPQSGRTIIYHLDTRTPEVQGAVQISN